MMNEWQVRQSPIFMALLAATTCSLMLSGGPGRQTDIHSYPLGFFPSMDSARCVRGCWVRTQQWLSLAHSELVMELLADHPATCIKLMSGHVGDLQQHG